MRRFVRVCGYALLTLVVIPTTTVLLSLVFILTGFNGNATFPVDCGLVFGAAISGRNTAGPAIVRRVGGAADLWKAGSIETLIFSGGKGDSWRLSEAAVMRQQAIREGVDGRDIIVEDAAKSTKANLALSKKLIGETCDSVVAISDQYHLARIRLLAKRAGWGSLATYGVPDRPERGEAWSVVRELAAYSYYAFGLDAFLTLDQYDDTQSVPDAGSGTLIP